MPQQPVKSLGPNNFRTDHEIGANMHCHLSNSRECTMRATFDKIAAARKFNNNCKNKTVVEIYSSQIRVIHSFLWIVMKQQNIKQQVPSIPIIIRSFKVHINKSTYVSTDEIMLDIHNLQHPWALQRLARLRLRQIIVLRAPRENVENDSTLKLPVRYRLLHRQL